VNLNACGDAGIHRMKSRIGPIGLLAATFTGGIWVPMSVSIHCAGSKSADAESLEEELGSFSLVPAGYGTGPTPRVANDEDGFAVTDPIPDVR
jgi:hypothetical protein